MRSVYQESKKLFPNMKQSCNLLQGHIYLHVRYVRHGKRKTSCIFFFENLLQRDSCEDMSSAGKTSVAGFDLVVLGFAFCRLTLCAAVLLL